MISKGFSNITIEDIRSRVTDFDILSYYLNIKNRYKGRNNVTTNNLGKEES